MLGRRRQVTLAAGARVNALVCSQVAAGAVAVIGQTLFQPGVDLALVAGFVLALGQYLAVPGQAVGSQGLQDMIGGTGLVARKVEIFHAHQPEALTGTCVQIAGQSREQGTKMQMPAWRRREASEIGAMGCDHGR